MVYQEGFRDPGQKSGFGSSQSLCPAPQWVVMAASYSPWVSLAAAPFPHPVVAVALGGHAGHFGLHTIP